MASTYSTSLRIQLIGTGDQSGTWGTTTNNNLGSIIEQAITGYATISVAGLTTYTLTAYNGIPDQSRNAVLEFTGALSANCTIIVPAVPKNYFVKNSTTGGYGIIISTGTGSTVTIPANQVFNVYSDGTNYYLATNYNAGSVAITGGTINGTSIGATTPSTGAFTTLSTTGALTYGGVTLSNSVTGTGSMVLSSAPILTTPLFSAETYSTNSSVSAAGTTQGTGTALTSDYNIVTTVAASAGVVLPTATIGRRIIIVNKGANALSVYPASGAAIDALSANAAISIPVAGWMEFNASTTTQWYSTSNITIASTSAVSSFSAGTTGFTPSSATTGAVTLAGTLNVANGGTGVTTSTGTGNVVLSTSPTLVTPILGTPTSGTLSSCTGLPLTTGVTGTLPIANGGTGQITANAALNALLPSQSTNTGKFLTTDGTNTSWATNPLGTVTSVGWTGGIVSIANPTTTPAFTIAGTSGGIPYFSSGTTWASSGALAANALVIGGGAGLAPSTTTTGTGILTFLGTPSSANLLAAMTDETGTGSLVFGTSPTIGTPTISGGSITSASVAATTLSASSTLNVTGAVTFNNATLNIPTTFTLNSTGAAVLPKGTSGQQPTGVAGMIRYNTTTNTFEGYNGTVWGSIAGGATAGGAVYENAQSISSNYTMNTNYNGESVGPITINSGVIVTIPSTSRWVIL